MTTSPKIWYRFEINLPPVVKKNGRDIGRNHATGQLFPIKSKKLRDYERDCTLMLQSQLNKMGTLKPLFQRRTVARYYFFFENECKADWDNICQALQDCAQKAGILKNDNLIKDAEVHLLENSLENKTIVEYADYETWRQGYAKLSL